MAVFPKNNVHSHAQSVDSLAKVGTGTRLSFLYFVSAWKDCLFFEGRSSRAMFWSFVVFNLITGGIIGAVAGDRTADAYFFLSFFPAWAVAVRRLHDAGKNGGWIMSPVVAAFAGGYLMQAELPEAAMLFSATSCVLCGVITYFLCLKSDGDNRYGAGEKSSTSRTTDRSQHFG